MLTLQLGILNGWNSALDNNAHKTFGGQIALALPDSKTNIYVNTYIGNENTGGVGKNTMLWDVVIGQALGDTVALSINADYFKQGDANWWGVGVKAKLGLHENFYIAPRFEYLKSKGGAYAGSAASFGPLPDPDMPLAVPHPAYTTDEYALYEATLTLGVPVAKNYEIRAEVRADMSDKEFFDKGGVPKKNQVSGTLGFLAWLP
jgi:hypothetical protein